MSNAHERLIAKLREEGWRIWDARIEKFAEREHEMIDVALFDDWVACRDADIQTAVRLLLKELGVNGMTVECG